ncbi:hypothetical protein [Planctomonas psychrotolerans]|uniref:hypothetical protein n=1 Tax=Planctomonas psychrotolerans TaxID=2528712 RepID=UPI001238FBC6|nr:hypothetical protein [Planctomonas psychrotolerans]
MAEKNEPEDTVGSDNTIPDTAEGIAVGHGKPSTFEPEEDEPADAGAADSEESDPEESDPEESDPA